MPGVPSWIVEYRMDISFNYLTHSEDIPESWKYVLVPRNPPTSIPLLTEWYPSQARGSLPSPSSDENDELLLRFRPE